MQYMALFWKMEILNIHGNAANAVTVYLKGNTESTAIVNCLMKLMRTIIFKLTEISLNPKNETSDAALDEYHEILINIKIDIKKNAERLHVTFVLNSEQGDPIFTFSSYISRHCFKETGLII